MQFYFLAWKRSLDFSGYSARKEFWIFLLVHILVTLGCIATDIAMNTWFDNIYSVLSFIPMLSAIVRRLHDIGKSGYWGLVFLVPVIGPFVLIYFLTLSSETQSDEETFA